MTAGCAALACCSWLGLCPIWFTGVDKASCSEEDVLEHIISIGFGQNVLKLALKASQQHSCLGEEREHHGHVVAKKHKITVLGKKCWVLNLQFLGV